jgi:hypothetical protein
MPARLDTGPFDESTDLRDLIRSEPDLVEPGLRVVDVDLDTGDLGRIDLLGVDRHGVLTLMAVAARSLDAALFRLLDGYRWAADQYAILTRAYAVDPVGPRAGATPGPDIRLLLLAPGFTHIFLRRLSLLTIPITPLLARQVPLHGGSRLLVEPAGPLFGLQVAHPPVREEVPPAATPQPFESNLADRDMADVLPAESPLEEAERIACETLGQLPPVDVPVASALTPADRELFTETLTSEEMEEFERFEHQRRGGDGELE